MLDVFINCISLVNVWIKYLNEELTLFWLSYYQFLINYQMTSIILELLINDNKRCRLFSTGLRTLFQNKIDLCIYAPFRNLKYFRWCHYLSLNPFSKPLALPSTRHFQLISAISPWPFIFWTSSLNWF